MNLHQPILEAYKLNKSYSNQGEKKIILKNISFQVNKGDIYGIIGASGAGKSTLLRSLIGLVSPDKGDVFFENQNLYQMNPKQFVNFRKQMGMVFQHFQLFHSRTVLENIAYPLEITGMSSQDIHERVDELLNLVHLSSKKMAYPSQLSGGEKQRVGIARALANRPKILFCDEATSALDSQTTKEILELLKTLQKRLNLTIILITHAIEVVQQLCNKVAVLDQGKMIERGSVVELFFDPHHPKTRALLEKSTHEIPIEYLYLNHPNRKLVRLKFKGDVTHKHFINEMIQQFTVSINILQGWIDQIQGISLGTLILEFQGEPNDLENAFQYLVQRNIRYEVIHGHCKS